MSGDQGGGRPGDERSGEPARTGARDGEPAAEEQPAKRKRMSAADRRDQLLDVTRDIVVAEGFAAVGIDRVARAAGVARALIYQQFGDLAGLTAVLLERETQVAFRGMQTVDWSGAQAEGADVDQVGRGILAYVHAAPDSWRILLSPPDGGPPQLRKQIEVGRRSSRAITARHLSRYAGVMVDPNGTTTRLLLASIEELFRLHLADPVACDDDTVLRYLRSMVGWAVRLEASRAG
ncbi:MAG TPA: TetR family transcriptional regulator [Nocardia sp.]|uniref:TetR/AcrR family transcriptional regulator n=1 Tax=Nocardia sp. TaxID=1821 RepID=UPI002B4AEAB2|nr:TetR family transcriptional regulator [Nocardia sp.]HLS77502.1 TetR family transcriptional regulator [Nocardia sp.]